MDDFVFAVIGKRIKVIPIDKFFAFIVFVTSSLGPFKEVVLIGKVKRFKRARRPCLR